MSSRYRTIVADPPWDHSDGFATVPDRPRAAARAAGADVTGATIITRALPYEHMTLEDICSVPLRDLADHDCNLFLWATNRFLPDAFDVLTEWGFRYRQMVVWSSRLARVHHSELLLRLTAPNTCWWLAVGAELS